MSLSLAELDKLAKRTGCSEYDDCLSCPLPRCIYDDKSLGMEARGKDWRKRKARELLGMGVSIGGIAQKLGVSRGTVSRALKEV